VSAEDQDATAAFQEYGRRLQAFRDARPAVVVNGRRALARLVAVTEGDSIQCRRVASFLLGLYNGTRFPFDLTDLRGLDFDLFDDCLDVLRMDVSPEQELHQYVDGGGERFEAMARDFAIPDRAARND